MLATVKVPILNGVYSDAVADYRTAFPLNMIVEAVDTGIDKSYLRPAEGLVLDGLGTGVDRGGINWRDQCYRVMGTTLIRINQDNTVTTVGEVGGVGQVSFTYGFDRLAIASGGRLYYYNGTTLTQVTDPDLGNVLDVVWIDGYFMTTDGTFLVVTDLADPTSVNPLKYGSAEASPDPIVSLQRIRNEVYAVNRYTVEVFDNVGGNLFPFSRVQGAQIQRGALSKTCATVYNEALAFIGGAVNETPSLWITSGSQSKRLATTEIDKILSDYTTEQLVGALLETRITGGHSFLYIHLPDKTIVYDGDTSDKLQLSAWMVLSSSLNGKGIYRARGFVYCYNKWLFGDPISQQFGHLSNSVMSHYGQRIGWEFSTPIMYNEGNGAIFHALNLEALTGRTVLTDDAYIATTYSTDGVTWSQPRTISMGSVGDRDKLLQWRGMGKMVNTRTHKFSGTSDAYCSFAALRVNIEPLNV